MQNVCANCRRPLVDPNGTCYACSPRTREPTAITHSPTPKDAAEAPTAKASSVSTIFTAVGLILIAEAVAPSWADKFYKFVNLFLQIPPDEAMELTISVMVLTTSILFGIWIYDRWSAVRMAERTWVPAWLTVLMCLAPVVSIGATLYFVSTIRNHFDGRDGDFLFKDVAFSTWLWWTSYHLALFAGSINASNGSGWEATCVSFGVCCLSFSFIVQEIASSGRAATDDQAE